MASRVLATDEARTTITQMQALLSGDSLTRSINSISKANVSVTPTCGTVRWLLSSAIRFGPSAIRL